MSKPVKKPTPKKYKPRVKPKSSFVPQELQECFTQYPFKIVSFIFLVFMISSLIFVMNSCTFAVTSVNTHGVADDVVDETEDTKADVSPQLTIPAKVV